MPSVATFCVYFGKGGGGEGREGVQYSCNRMSIVKFNISPSSKNKIMSRDTNSQLTWFECIVFFPEMAFIDHS